MAALTDTTTTVAELKSRVLAFVRERDWEQFHSPKNLSMALAAEAGELMEHFLWATPEQSSAVAKDPANAAYYTKNYEAFVAKATALSDALKQIKNDFAQALQGIVEAANRPKTVVRDSSGKVVGVK